MRTRLLRTLVALATGAVALTGCGDDDSSPAADGGGVSDDGGGEPGAADDGSPEEEDWPPADLFGTGEAGTVTVDGVTYGIDATRQCDVSDFFAGDDRTREFMVQGVGAADPDDEYSESIEVTVHTGTQENPEADAQGIGWDGPEGLYDGYASGNGTWTSGTSQLDGPPLEVGDDRITGELTLRSSLGSPPVDVTVDLARPSGDPVPCD